MLGYDSAGNVITWPGYMGGTATYTYDAENHLTQVAVPSGSFTYTYDGDGRRVMKSSAGTGTIYWHDTGSNVLLESDLAGNDQAFYDYFYANAVYQAYGPMRARLNPLDPSDSQGAYFHGQFGDAFHSEGWTHGCLSYGRDTTMIDYMSGHFGNTWTGVSVDTQVEKPQ